MFFSFCLKELWTSGWTKISFQKTFTFDAFYVKIEAFWQTEKLKRAFLASDAIVELHVEKYCESRQEYFFFQMGNV